MKKEELPQDPSSLKDITREVCYVQNNEQKYETGLSTGWEVKAEALKITWDEIHKQIDEAKKEVVEGRRSILYYYMTKNLMDSSMLAKYAGLWKFTVNRHMKPGIFIKLSDKQLSTYAVLFNVSISDLKNNRFI